MSYTAWSVVFGEQPSAAKWNLLGSNDAEFNSMIVHTSGGLTTLNDIRTQTDNSDSIASATTDNFFVQFGWGQREGDGTASISSTVTFPTAFTSILGVAVSHGAAKATSAAADITGLVSAAGAGAAATWDDLTTTSVVVNLTRTANYAAGNFYGFSWIAWGTKT